jgi:serine-type D-Ala-D-Ala carboxypeptidase/endopeptidase (penicillin-binding protein 4)
VQRATGAAFVTVVALLAAAAPSRAVDRVQAPVQAPAVLKPATVEGVAPTSAGITRVLTPALRDPTLGKHVGAYVYDVQRRKVLFNTAGTFVPASTMKVLTTTAALAAIGPDHRFTTKVVGTGSSIVLVGGGDPLLASRRPAAGVHPDPVPATLPDLAAATATALRAKGIRAVSLGYDASLFTGPAANQHWLPKYVTEGIVSPTSALWTDEGRKVPGMAARWPDPARAGATAFAQQLKAAGIKVTAAPRALRAKPGSAVLAQVRSPRLAAIAERVNLASDNDGAEVLLRQIGVATGNGGSSAGGLKGLRTTLTGLGLDLSTARIQDGSGLSRTNGVPLRLLAAVVTLAASDAHPELRAVVTGLPVAGFTGSLADRFTGAGAVAGSGYVRAKTGTLTSVHSLAGVVRDRTGTLLVFAIATDSAAPNKALAARTALDRAAGALASCGCA